jgi:hypothetical protein
MVRALQERPSVAVGLCAVAVVAWFVVRGDLRVHWHGVPAAAAVESPPAPNAPMPSAPVVVRRAGSNQLKASVAATRVRVFDALGFLLAGASLENGDDVLRTDAEGSCRIEFERRSVRDVLVRAGGAQPRWWRLHAVSPDIAAVQLAAAAPWDAPATALPPAAQRQGEGTLHGADGKALAFAFVVSVGLGEWARTDEFGRYRVALPVGLAELLVHAPGSGAELAGQALLAEPFRSERAEGLVPLPDLTAAAGQALRGTVRDSRGEPIEGVPVVVRGQHLVRVLETGVGGAFQLGGLLPGSYAVEPFACRGDVGVATTVTLAGPVQFVDLALQATSELRIAVVDEAGAPCRDLLVASVVGALRRGVGPTDVDGFVTLPVIAGHTTFEVRHGPEFAPVTVRSWQPDAARLVVARSF